MTDSLDGQTAEILKKKSFHVYVCVVGPSPESAASYILGSRRLIFLLQNMVTDVERCLFNPAFRADV